MAASRLDRGGERERTPIRESGRPEFRVLGVLGGKGRDAKVWEGEERVQGIRRGSDGGRVDDHTEKGERRGRGREGMLPALLLDTTPKNIFAEEGGCRGQAPITFLLPPLLIILIVSSFSFSHISQPM